MRGTGPGKKEEKVKVKSRKEEGCAGHANRWIKTMTKG
jgi:hypothetical protein